MFDTFAQEHSLHFDKHTETTSFVGMVSAHSFVSVINRPTRVTKNSAALINYVLANCFITLSLTCLIYKDVSDHFAIGQIHFEMRLYGLLL